MSKLAVTIIDVGWGDSILVESVDDQGFSRFGLIDCNDYEKERSSLIFVKRYFDRMSIDHENTKHNFEWVLLTHGHADHARGLKRILQTFGTKNFWYPKSVQSTTYGTLLNYANRSNNVLHHQSIDNTKILNDPNKVNFGDVTLEVLWPNHNQVDQTNENNNSVVLSLTLGNVSFVLSGDAEADVWSNIIHRIPATTKVFHHPHHGARNGLFTSGGGTPWLDKLAQDVHILLSSHIRPHGHPHADVVSHLDNGNFSYLRTDLHFHIRVETEGSNVKLVFSR